LPAAEGINMTGIDPAEASVDVARKKSGTEHVEWIVGDANLLPADTALSLFVGH
jgi:ubiquinone/menaquinone biosynthesis C-methylase UbiE